jgi:DNA polymerase-3 subunit beta
MHISLEREALLRALSHQQGLIERRSTVPILAHILLETQDENTLRLTGTDLEISLVETIPCTVKSKGSVTVPAHIFHDIVRKLPDDLVIHLEHLAGSTLRLRSGSSEFTLPTLPVDDFPKIHEQELLFQLKIPAASFKQLIEATRFSMSNEEARYTINGIYFHSIENQWRAVATDTYRLALSWIPFPAETLEGLPNVIVGKKTIQEISKLLDECSSEVALSLSPRQLVLEFEGGRFSSRLLEGQFPDYWQAIPQENPHSIAMETRLLTQAIARVGMVSPEKNRLIKLVFEDNTLTLSAHSQQYGSALEKLAISYGGEPITIGFNPKYFLDICNHIKGDSILMILRDGLSPALFKDPQNDMISYILMPMRV